MNQLNPLKLKVFLFAVFLYLAGGAAAASGDSRIAGLASVVDGDTLDIGETRIRLHGIDAPESGQLCRRPEGPWACGEESTAALERMAGGKPVSCRVRDRDRYGRAVAVCRARDVDLNGWMVRSGWAFAYRRYSLDYVTDEEAARNVGRGIWQGDAVPPWEWRKGRRL